MSWVCGQLPEEWWSSGGIVGISTPPPQARMRVWEDVWLATRQALIYLHRKGRDLWTSREGLPTPLLSLACGLEGTVYLGTEGSGVFTWGGPKPHRRIEEAPKGDVSLLLFSASKGFPLVLAGYGTSKRPPAGVAVAVMAETQGGLESPARTSEDAEGKRREWEVCVLKAPEQGLYPSAAVDTPKGMFVALSRIEVDGSSLLLNISLERRESGELAAEWSEVAKPSLPCTCLEYLPQGEAAGLWAGTTEGLLLFPSRTLGRDKVSPTRLPRCPDTGPVHCLLRDTRGWMLVAGERGLFLYDGEIWRRFKDPPDNPLGGITGLAENGMGDIYAVSGKRHLWLRWSSKPGFGGVSSLPVHSLTTPLG